MGIHLMGVHLMSVYSIRHGARRYIYVTEREELGSIQL
jgi:hypothetical protein